MKKMKFVRSWRAYRSGQVAEISGGLATQLLAQGVAVEDRQQQLIETAAVEPEAETADATPRRVKRAVPKPRTPDRSGR
jgi:hypothetical protein